MGCVRVKDASAGATGGVLGVQWVVAGAACSFGAAPRRGPAPRRTALHDPLTGLPNRADFEECVRCVRSGAASRRDSVLFVDVDDFKAVNDTYGHAVGDAVLQQAAQP